MENFHEAAVGAVTQIPLSDFRSFITLNENVSLDIEHKTPEDITSDVFTLIDEMPVSIVMAYTTKLNKEGGDIYYCIITRKGEVGPVCSLYNTTNSSVLPTKYESSSVIDVIDKQFSTIH